MKKNTKNFSFSEFMSFSESLVESLDTISNKVAEVTNQIETLEAVIGGDDAPVAEEPVAAEENVEAPVEEEQPAPEAVVEETVTEEAPVADAPTEENVEAPVEEPAPAPEATDANDEAAINAMSEEDQNTEDNNFSSKYLVVGLKNRPWGNRVITEKEFSEVEHRKLIPTLFSTRAQAQRALTSYNITGENFSIRYNNVKSILNM